MRLPIRAVYGPINIDAVMKLLTNCELSFQLTKEESSTWYSLSLGQ